MKHDPAQFRREDILSVYSERPRCLITGLWQFCDLSHVLGRGYREGHNLKSDGRAAYSSILNCAPLCRDIHKSAFRDQRHMRALLLEIAEMHVQSAVREGRYEYTDIDAAFREIKTEWFLAQFPQEQ